MTGFRASASGRATKSTRTPPNEACPVEHLSAAVAFYAALVASAQRKAWGPMVPFRLPGAARCGRSLSAATRCAISARECGKATARECPWPGCSSASSTTTPSAGSSPAGPTGACSARSRPGSSRPTPWAGTPIRRAAALGAAFGLERPLDQERRAKPQRIAQGPGLVPRRGRGEPPGRADDRHRLHRQRRELGPGRGLRRGRTSAR